MPHARPPESFVWRAAARPERVRLLGAIAIAVSCGGLGVVVGRWSAPLAPAAPATRTAALIQAVAKETRAKMAAPDRATADAAPATPAAAPRDEPVPVAPSRDPARGQEVAAEPALAVVPPAGDAPPAPAQAKAPDARPGGRRSQQAATVEERPAAPNYQALRDYVLSR
jgi:hypothetical protein